MSGFSPLSTLKKLAKGASANTEARTLGRFELRKILGRGAQSIVWLAFDPRLEREVAIKLMKGSLNTDAGAVAQWLQEARSVSRLTHPNIVPVFEADVQEQQPYLVFEYVLGETLTALLERRGALPPTEAAMLMLDVLDALASAHSAGVVHRDLKPSNVLIEASGRARVMDFGIAARIKTADESAHQNTAGTPGYMSPEAVQALPVTPSMDIFSAGLILAELLCGQPLIQERDPYRAMYRVAHEQLTLPNHLSSDVDDQLRAIVLRALAHEPANRQPSAQLFREELVRWLGGSSLASANEVTLAASSNTNSTLDFLLRRMRHTSDFPAMSDAVARIQGMASSETESISNFTNEILKDVALTNKLLRLVNSAYYARGGSISTVSRAVSLVGFNGVRNMALSLVLLERMQDKAHAAILKEEFLRSLMAGAIAGELCPWARDNEPAFIGAMFHNLGRLLAEFYFPQEARMVRGIISSGRQTISEASASTSVLGLSFEALGVGVAKAWGLPEGIQRCMHRPTGEPPNQVPQESAERLRWMALAANDMADVLLRVEPKAADARLAQVAKRYTRTLGVSSAEMQVSVTVARKKLIDMAHAMDINVRPESAASKLLKAPPILVEYNHDNDDTVPDTLTPLELHHPNPVQQRIEMLAAGVQDITNAMLEDVRLGDLLRMILETMFRAMDFQRIAFCLRDAKTDAITGRFGLGRDIDHVLKSFNVPLKSARPDLFAGICVRGVDALISDTSEAHIAARLPAWYLSAVNAPTFLLLPVNIKGKPLGLIYADQARKGALVLDEKELSLLQTLRNQAVMAFRQPT